MHDKSVSQPTTPKKKRLVDRYIPARDAHSLQAAYSIAGEPNSEPRGNSPADQANRTYSTLLKAELFGSEVPSAIPLTPSGSSTHSSPDRPESKSLPTTPRKAQNKNIFTYSPGRRSIQKKRSTELFSSSPVRPESQKLLLSPKKRHREISKTPFRVLDAPNLADDFYLNLLDWGSQNQLAVGLGNLVYIWDANLDTVGELCALCDDTVTSVSWIKSGTHLAVGTESGKVQIWDATTSQRLRSMTGQTERVSSLSWNSHILSSGSHDRTILHRDVRVPEPYIMRLSVHRGEVCGLRWNTELDQLASGCNDNKLMIWSGLSQRPLYSFDEHKAAVKALAWSPHQRGLLASGGGSNDTRICFWNTLTGTPVSSVYTGSQVSNLAWGTHTRELVSTHGCPNNHMAVWKYPSMETIATLTGHTYRVLYMAMSPDGQSIVTGAGDETLRLWNVFNERKIERPSVVNLYRQLR